MLISWHPVIAFYTIAAAYAGAAFTVSMLPAVKTDRSIKNSAGQDLVDGFRYALGNRKLLAPESLRS